MKRPLLLVFLLTLTFCSAYAKDHLKGWHQGVVVSTAGDTLHCYLRLTRKVSEGLLQVTQNGIQSRILTVKEVKAFSYYDPEKKYDRVFYAVVMQPETSGKPHGVFTESLYSNDEYGIVNHRTMGVSEKNFQINPFRKRTVVDNLYLVKRADKSVRAITHQEALDLLASEREKIMVFLKTNARLKSINDYTAAIDPSHKTL